ncbi:MAG: N-acetylglucosamine-6-phosphate deacetylase [Clostridiaceae bacterium]|nr:N-acetylglucosamine-6-phosphate deacetylase [Eubacteriales bacterium]
MKLKSKRVFVGGTFLPATLEVENGKIAAVLGYGEPGAEDWGNARVVPGFIDVHTHGAYGAMANYCSEEELKLWTSKLPDEGVTAYLPTVFTETPDNIAAACGRIANAMESKPAGAEILGIHLEGPFLNAEYKGAMNPARIIAPDTALFERWQLSARGHVRYITIAPEKDEGYRFTRCAAARGVVVSIGHSAATYEQAMYALGNGARCFTHAFNAMKPLNHREPGCVGALMRSDAYTELIFDGHHVSMDVVQILFRTKGRDRIVGISDSLALKAAPPGEYSLDERVLVVNEEGSAFIKGTNTLAGSTLMYNKGLRLLVEAAELPISWALAALSENPARLLGLDHRLGYIRVGYDADLVVLGDDYSVLQTYCKGKANKA